MSSIAEKFADLLNNSIDYMYIPIIETKYLVNMKVNLLARISEVGLRRRSRGTDYCLVLKIVDFSCPTAARSVNFFARDKENLPKVESVGDIICLHRVVVKVHNEEFYFLFGKSFSSFALFHGKIHMGLYPYLTSANYCATDGNNELIGQLRTLSLEQSDAGTTSSLSLLSSIEVGKVLDLLCKVLHASVTSEGECVLFVWDGTDIPPVAFKSNLDMEIEKPSPLHPELSLLPRETLCSFPCVGTILRVTAGRFIEDIHYFQSGGHWVKLYNVSCELQSEIWTGVMNDSSRVFILSDENGNAKIRNRMYNERVASKSERIPMLRMLEYSHVTETDYENVSYATLMDSITNSQVVHRCKCVVRVITSCPWRGEDLRSPVDGHYRVRLTLEDPTARVHAYIIDEEGDKFYGGNLRSDDLTKKMKKLLGIKDAHSEGSEVVSRNPPWIKCCLVSYYLDENDQFGSRRYRIFGTRLLD